jgi:UDP-sugar transporter A1/2/3
MESKTDRRTQAGLFAVQVGLWTAWTLWIKYTQGSGGVYPYETITVVLVAEIVKLAIMQVYYLYVYPSRASATERLALFGEEWRYGLYFAIPALLYWVYNLLFYVNMSYFDPGTFRVLINVRILILGVLVRLMFGTRLSPAQWGALLLLAGGCAINQIGPGFTLDSPPQYLLLLLLQASLSAFAGVYNEFLLKQEDHRPFALKNSYLYLFSIVLSCVYILMLRPELFTSVTLYFRGWSASTVALVLLQALCGVSTSLLLRHLNVILKEYAQALEMIATALIAWGLLDGPLTGRLLLSVVAVSASALLYSRRRDSDPVGPETSQPGSAAFSAAGAGPATGSMPSVGAATLPVGGIRS